MDHALPPKEGAYPSVYLVVKTVAEAQSTFDYIVCAHKAINPAAAPAQIAPGVDEKKTTIVIIQNGVGNEEPFRKHFPSATILSCVVRTANPATPVYMYIPYAHRDLTQGEAD